MTEPKRRKKNNWRIDREYQRTEEKWLATGEIRYAVLAIGEWYERSIRKDGATVLAPNPPSWALEACRLLREKAEFDIEPVINPTQGGRPDKADYARIDRVAMLHYQGSDASPYELFKQVLTEEGLRQGALFDVSLRRLLNYYEPFVRSRDDGILNKHVSRIARQEAKRRGFGSSIGDL